MQATTRRHLTQLAAVLILSARSMASGATIQEPVVDETIERIAQAANSIEASSRIRELLSGYEPLLAELPLEDLEDVSLRRSRLELRFDFDGDSHRRVELPAKERWILNKKRRAERETTSSRSLRVNRRLRFDFDSEGICAVVEGDLEVKAGIFWFDLSLSTELTPLREVCNAEGRPVLVEGSSGRPIKRDGRFLRETSRRWLVLEAKGRKVEIPIGDRTSEANGSGD